VHRRLVVVLEYAVAHQFGGIGMMAGDWNTYGRIYVSGTGRGLLYSN
jgi:hypothetical protein